MATHSQHEFKIMEEEPFIAAMRGRGAIKQTTQQLEPRSDGVTNTITSVEKDNLLVKPHPQVVGNYKPSGYDSGNVFHTEGIAPTVRENHGSVVSITEPQTYPRIRKLTERELFRLMGVDDTDIDTLLSCGVSNTQLKKMAGNSIVVDVLYHIFDKLLVHTDCDTNRQMTLF